MNIVFENPAVPYLADLYAKSGVEARPVGGSVRDRLLGKTPKDDDFAVNAMPDEVMAIANNHGIDVVPTGLKHGTVTLVLDKVGYEFTTLRVDAETDGRHAKVKFVGDFKLDAARRDFTINAMSADQDGRVYDYFGGVEHLRQGRVVFVGNAADRIQEDYLRILRYFRFRSRFGFGGDEATLDAITSHAEGLTSISRERIWKEMSQILSSARPTDQLHPMAVTGVLSHIGMPSGADVLADIENIRAFTDDPAVILGAVVREVDPIEFGVSWRLSYDEVVAMQSASEALQDDEVDSHYWQCRVIDGANPEATIAVLKATGRHEAATALLNMPPPFPVGGKDLIAVGFVPGKGIGTEIMRLKQIWKDSKFAVSKADLLENAQTSLDGLGVSWPSR